jgi:hypothetical protein
MAEEGKNEGADELAPIGSAAPTFAPKTSPIAVWICIGLACVMLILWAHETGAHKAHPFLYTILGFPCCLPLLAYGFWLTQPPLLPVVFRESPALPALKRYYIKREMTLFSHYLADVGFDLPKALPVVTSASRARFGSVGTEGGPSPYSWSMNLAPDLVMSRWAITTGYSIQIFHILFDASNNKRVDFINRFGLTRDYYTYYVDSYLNHTEAHELPIIMGLWEIRSRFGKDFTDHGLLYAYNLLDSQTPDPSATGDEDDYLREHLMRGFRVMVGPQFYQGDVDSLAAIDAILKAHGVHQGEDLPAASKEAK